MILGNANDCKIEHERSINCLSLFGYLTEVVVKIGGGIV